MTGAPSPRRRAFRIAALLLPVAALAATEGVLRLAGAASGDAAERAASGARFVDMFDARLFERDRELFWRFRSSFTYRLGDPAFPPFTTSRLGLRGPDLAEKAPGELRVLCMGDSVTFGLGLSDGSTYPDLLGEALQDVPGGVRVVNAGVPGYSSVQGQRLLRRLDGATPPIGADVIVWWFGMNDAKPAFGPEDAELVPPEEPSPFAGAMGRLHLVRAIRSTFAPSPDPARRRVPPDRAGAIAESVRSTAANAGARVVFVASPHRLDERLRQFDRVLAALGACGASTVRAPGELLSPWTPAPRPGDLVHRVDTSGGEPVVVFGDGAAPLVTAGIDVVTRRRDDVAAWLRALEAHAAALPSDRLGHGDLFGPTERALVMSDNCHLTPDGARMAAAAIASEIRRRTRR